VLVAAIGVLSVVASGCLQPSLNPLFAPEEAVLDARLIGTWTCGNEVWTITRRTEKKAPPNAHELRISAGENESRLFLWLGRLAGRLFVTFALDEVEVRAVPFVTGHLIGAYTFGRIDLETDRFTISMLDSEWIETADKAGQLTLGVARHGLGSADEPDLVLTATPAELQRFAATHASDDDVFGERVVLMRVPSAAASPDTRETQCYGKTK
jgi:hypothetical protein